MDKGYFLLGLLRFINGKFRIFYRNFLYINNGKENVHTSTKNHIKSQKKLNK